jgi:hypothetical protein
MGFMKIAVIQLNSVLVWNPCEEECVPRGTAICVRKYDPIGLVARR